MPVKASRHPPRARCALECFQDSLRPSVRPVGGPNRLSQSIRRFDLLHYDADLKLRATSTDRVLIEACKSSEGAGFPAPSDATAG